MNVFVGRDHLDVLGVDRSERFQVAAIEQLIRAHRDLGVTSRFGRRDDGLLSGGGRRAPVRDCARAGRRRSRAPLRRHSVLGARWSRRSGAGGRHDHILGHGAGGSGGAPGAIYERPVELVALMRRPAPACIGERLGTC